MVSPIFGASDKYGRGKITDRASHRITGNGIPMRMNSDNRPRFSRG